MLTCLWLENYIGPLISIISQDLGSAVPIREGIAQVKPSTVQEGCWEAYLESFGFFFPDYVDIRDPLLSNPICAEEFHCGVCAGLEALSGSKLLVR